MYSIHKKENAGPFLEKITIMHLYSLLPWKLYIVPGVGRSKAGTGFL